MKIKVPYGTTADNDRLVLPAGQLSVDVENKALRLHDGVTGGGVQCVGRQAWIPGSTLLAGDAQLGWYGVVSEDQLISRPALSQQLGFTWGTDIHPNAGWLKFAHQGKILYIAKKPVRSRVSWDNLNSQNLTVGTRTITIGSSEYKVRLMTGVHTAGSEWNDLIFRVHQFDPTGTNWAAFTDNDFGLGTVPGESQHQDGSETICQEKHPTPTNTGRLTRNSVNSPGYRAPSDAGPWMGWRPVLELVQ